MQIWTLDSGRTPPRDTRPIHTLHHDIGKGVCGMYGAFGGYTRWAVVFLIIFVLFFLLVPGHGGYAGGAGVGAGAGAGGMY